jgi:hypothetical protein
VLNSEDIKNRVFPFFSSLTLASDFNTYLRAIFLPVTGIASVLLTYHSGF